MTVTDKAPKIDLPYNFFPTRSLILYAIGIGTIVGIISAGVSFFVSLYFFSPSQQQPKQGTFMVITPPQNMISQYGEPNREIAKHPLKVWVIDTPEFLEKVLSDLETGFIEKGTQLGDVNIGDYILYFADHSGKGYVGGKKTVESGYVVTE